MVKMNWSGLVVLTAVTLGSALGLGTAPRAHAEDLRAPMMQKPQQRPDNVQRGAVMVRIAQARAGAGQRRETPPQRSQAMERRDEKRPAQMKRDAPTRERAETVRGGNGPTRSR